MTSLHRILSALCLALCVPSVVLGQGSVTTTTSTCTAYGVTGTTYIQVDLTIGPGTTLVGDRGSCTLQPPAPGCGTGTLADPYHPDCGQPLGIASFTSGNSFEVLNGTSNINTNTLTLVPTAAVQTSIPVPLNLWVPLGSGMGIVLLTLLRLRRSNTIGQR